MISIYYSLRNSIHIYFFYSTFHPHLHKAIPEHDLNIKRGSMFIFFEEQHAKLKQTIQFHNCVKFKQISNNSQYDM